MTLRLLTYNICFGGRSRESQILQVLHSQEADIILLQEVTQPSIAVDLAAALDMRLFLAQGNAASIALLSKFPITEERSHHPFPPVRDTVLEAAISYAPNCVLYVIGVHPIAYPGTLFEYWRNWELKIALDAAAVHGTKPCILAGDFNAIGPADKVLTDSAPTFMRLLYRLQGGRVFRQSVQRVLASGFVDCFRYLHPVTDGFTIPTPDPKVRLDYVFANATMLPFLRRCEVVSSPDAVHHASDHYPLVADYEMS